MNPNVLASWALLSRLKERGVSHVVISPGSRSTPLAYVAHLLFDTTVVIDERDAGFVALGISESTCRPAVVITTSGSAPTHLYPSIVESFHSNVPMIVISADRPHEVRGRGAPQTIDQINLYHSSVRYFFDAPCPHDDADVELWHRCADDLFTHSVGIATVPGPIHLNMGMREPLVPDGDEMDVYQQQTLDQDLPVLTPQHFGFNSAEQQSTFVFDNKIAHAMSESPSVMVTVGRNSGLTQTDIAVLQEKNWVVLADVTSDLRSCDGVMEYYDFVLRLNEKKRFLPELIVQFGDPLTSKYFNESVAESHTIAVRQYDDGRDPYGNARNTIIERDVSRVVDAISDLELAACNKNFAQRWISANDHIGQFVKEYMGENPESEPALYYRISERFKDTDIDFNLVIASSMPIRYCEWFGSKISARCATFSHRGTNGIDGMLASTYGIAHGSSCATLCVLGDVAFSHDMGFLPHAVHGVQLTKSTCVFLVVDNNGGAIFSHLDQARNETLHESYPAILQTPPVVDIEKISLSSGAYYFSGLTEDCIDYAAKALEASTPSVYVVHVAFSHTSGVETMAELREKITSLTV